MKDKTLGLHWISTTKAAELLGVSRITVFKKIKAGMIKAEKVGRNYLISVDEMNRVMGKRGPLTPEDKARIDKAIQRAVKQYGTALRMLGKE
jgi:excisionase family DNA binding protein